MPNIEILNDSGKVINTIVASEVEAERRAPGRWRLAENQPSPEPAPAPTPRHCTPAQGLVALYAVKQITEDDIRAVIEGIPDPVTRYTAKIGYERATQWIEDSPTMQMMQTAFNLTDADMTALFDYAQTVAV